ncbi:hypothetical protein GBF38_016627 [Nibea albiflora]|uniref:Uncharacterized protein n=1 Tax=Nibea albiflora TaxID=240163 RepID=A0ACB7ERT5_NIBAL|nr:hypothetical protein GBF38_016627 [Nibea albiflora]
MTKTRTNGECPICGKVLQMVAKHLRETHLIKNGKERAILNSMATGRTVIPPGPCPIQGCSPAIINVDKHLKAHKELTYEQIAEERRKAKRAAAIKALAALRASSPDPLMQTRLDLADPGEAASEEEPCQTCRTSKVKIRNLTVQVKRLKRQVADLKSQMRRGRPAQQPSLDSSDSEEPQQQPPQRKTKAKPQPQSSYSSTMTPQPQQPPPQQQPSLDSEEPQPQPQPPPQQATKRRLHFSSKAEEAWFVAATHTGRVLAALRQRSELAVFTQDRKITRES